MGFSRQEYWSGLPFPSPGDLPNPGIEPRSPALLVDALPSETQGKLGSTHTHMLIVYNYLKISYLKNKNKNKLLMLWENVYDILLSEKNASR